MRKFEARIMLWLVINITIAIFTIIRQGIIGEFPFYTTPLTHTEGLLGIIAIVALYFTGCSFLDALMEEHHEN